MNLKPKCKHMTAFPCKILFFLSDEIEGLQEGDRIYSIYEHNGEYYASFEREVYHNSRVSAIGMAFSNGGWVRDDEEGLKIGFNHNEVINWGIWRDGNMFELQITDEYNQQGAGEFSFRYAKGIVTQNIIPVNDNLYYTLDPVWRYENGYVEELQETPNYNHKIDFALYRPARRESCTVSIIKGEGEVRSPDQWSCYYLKKEDLYEGEIKFAVDVVPFRNSTTNDTHREYTIKFPALPRPEPKPEPSPKKYQFQDFKKDINSLSIISTLVSGTIGNETTAILRYRSGNQWILETFEFEAGNIEIPIDKNKTTLPYCWVTFYTNDYRGRRFALTISVKL